MAEARLDLAGCTWMFIQYQKMWETWNDLLSFGDGNTARLWDAVLKFFFPVLQIMSPDHLEADKESTITISNLLCLIMTLVWDIHEPFFSGPLGVRLNRCYSV